MLPIAKGCYIKAHDSMNLFDFQTHVLETKFFSNYHGTKISVVHYTRKATGIFLKPKETFIWEVERLKRLSTPNIEFRVEYGISDMDITIKTITDISTARKTICNIVEEAHKIAKEKNPHVNRCPECGKEMGDGGMPEALCAACLRGH